jgi:hypothetical protein
MVFLAEKSANIRSHMVRVGQNHIYTVYIRYFWEGNCRRYGHIRCISTVILAGKLPQMRSYTVYIYGIFGREIAADTVIYGVYLRF